jgi:hypothetical protein
VAGCECNRTTAAAITASGLTIASIEHGRFPRVPKFAAPLISGAATAP